MRRASGPGRLPRRGTVLLAAVLFPLGPIPTGAELPPEVVPCDHAAPEYYRMDLVTTGRVLGTGRASGLGHVSFGGTPYGVSLAPDGSYRYELTIEVSGLPTPEAGAYVAWVTTPELDQVSRLGTVGPGEPLVGEVRWNKFLVVVSLEPAPVPGEGAPRWSGPVVLRGMSRSGGMHTMLGHGPFQVGDCASIGFR